MLQYCSLGATTPVSSSQSVAVWLVQSSVYGPGPGLHGVHDRHVHIRIVMDSCSFGTMIRGH